MGDMEIQTVICRSVNAGTFNSQFFLPSFQETVYFLEESSRELKTELKIQKKKTKETEELRDSLAKQLLLYR